MASAVCRSKFLTNFHVQKVSVLDITESRQPDVNRNHAWNYVISVSWSDGRETKVYREYIEITDLYNLIRDRERQAKSKNDLHVPKVPGRGFFDWNLIKFMIKNQPKVDLFLQVLITLPKQFSRLEQVLDFFETRSSDNVYPITSLANVNTSSNFAFGKASGNSQTAFQNEQENCDYLTADRILNHENNRESTKRTLQPPSYLPVTSCFEPNDVIDDETCGYQMLLEDVTSFDLYEDYDVLYEFPLKNLIGLENGLLDSSSSDSFSRFDEDARWLKECEEILLPYSPNKAYFRLVQELEIS